MPPMEPTTMASFWPRRVARVEMARKVTMQEGMVVIAVTVPCSRVEPAMQANRATLTAPVLAVEASLSVEAESTSIWMARLPFRVSQ